MSGTPEITMSIFFSHSGNTNMTKFCTCAQDLHWFVQKVSGKLNEFYICVVSLMMNWKETLTSDCGVSWNGVTAIHFCDSRMKTMAKVYW